MVRLSRNQIWILSAILVSLATLGFLFAPAALAQDKHGQGWTSSLAALSHDQQIFNEDLLVAAGQVIPENVTVIRGDVEIEEEGSIQGDLTVIGGDVTIAGTLDGVLAVVGGDVDLESTASISGDVSVLGGRLERAPEAYIGGNFVGGPRVDMKELERLAPDMDVETFSPDRPRRSPFLGFLVRLLQAVLWTFLITGLVVLVTWLFPRQIETMSRTAEQEPALSFATGLIVSLAVFVISALLGLTVILVCFSVLLIAILAVIALVGWTVTSVWLGKKVKEVIGDRNGTRFHSLVPVALSALILTGVTFLCWALLPCLGAIVALLIGFTGTGAVLVHQARRAGLGGGRPDEDGGPPPVAPMNPPVNEQPAATPSDEHPPATDEGTADVEDDSGDSLGRAVEPDEPPPLPAKPDEPDDFTKIRGIGPTFNQRLHAAGITRFGQLADMQPEAIAQVLGWPPERVTRDQLREQAADLATA